MGRKRKKLKGLTEKKERKIEDPNPNSEDFMYDEIDQFHRSKDKILLDPSQAEESDFDENEIEDDEVLAIDESDDEDDDNDDDLYDDAGEEMDDDAENEGMSDDDDLFAVEKDDGIPGDKAWGRHKKTFYDADVLDEDVYASDEDAEQAADDEEKEAMMLQKRMASNLDSEDFMKFDQTVETDEEDHAGKEETIQKDLSSLTKKEKIELLAKQSPELLPLMQDYKEKLTELKEKYSPLLAMCKEGIIEKKEAVLFIEMKHQLTMSYLANITFYLVLKSSGENLKGHPIFDRLLQHKETLKSMENLEIMFMETYGDDLQEYINSSKQKTGKKSSEKKKSSKRTPKVKFADEVKANSKSTNGDITEESDDVDPLEYYNQIKSKKEREKLIKKLSNENNDEDLDIDDENIDEDEKRKITYEISKNKGLIRKRRKELKNPRVKHKVKFKKAKIKHKGQVAEIKREMQRYGGELSGIKSSISKSVKIK